MATINIGSLTFTHKGDYASGTAYVKNDVVYYATNGNAYIAKTSTTGNAPTSTAHWDVFAAGSGGIWNAGLSLGSAGQVVKVNSGATDLEFGDAGGGLQSTQVFTASGTYTKPAGINKIRVFVTGAGASGGMGTANYNAGGGGGAGATAIELIDVSSLSSTVAVTVGTGGTVVTATSTNGVSGGASSFGSYCTGGGGIQGANADQSGLSDGGTATGGDINIRGGDGGCAAGGNSNDERMVASGGSSYWGGGGKGAKPNTSQTGATNGQAGKAYGSGGGGGYYDGSNYASGAGKDGLVYIEEYK